MIYLWTYIQECGSIFTYEETLGGPISIKTVLMGGEGRCRRNCLPPVKRKKNYLGIPLGRGRVSSTILWLIQLNSTDVTFNRILLFKIHPNSRKKIPGH